MLQVGDIYPDFKGLQDSIIFSTILGGLTLIYSLKSPTTTEIYSFRYNSPKFALVENNDMLLCFIQLEKNNWNCTATNYSLTPELCNINENENLLKMLMFDSDTGKLVALRAIGLGRDFTKTLVKAIKKQVKNPHTLEEFSKKASYILSSKYQSEESILKDAFCLYDFEDSKKAFNS